MTLDDKSRIRGIDSSDVGISNSGTLTLNDASLITAYAIAVQNSGTLTLNDASRISHNGAFNWNATGPAVLNSGRLTLNDTARIGDNWLGVENMGTVTLNGSSSIRHNRRTYWDPGCAHCPTRPRLVGAGVSNRGSLTLNDSSSISGNSAADDGAGVYLWEGSGASLTMTGSSTIAGNTTSKSGGGVYAGAGTTLVGVTAGRRPAPTSTAIPRRLLRRMSVGRRYSSGRPVGARNPARLGDGPCPHAPPGRPPATAASDRPCRVADPATGQTYTRLQQAVDAAKPGARLIVNGICYGGTFIDRDITIVGQGTERTSVHPQRRR